VKHVTKATYGFYAFLMIMLVLTLAPFYMLVNIAFKDLNEFYVDPMGIAPPFHPDNFIWAWDTLGPSMLNSTVITGASVFGALLLSSVTAFLLARFKFPGREVVFGMLLALLMIPGVLTLVPLFSFIIQLGLINTKLAIILPAISGGCVFNTFMLRSFFASLPEEMFEAARVDGAGFIRQWWSFTMPLSTPILSVLAIWGILGTWNDYIWTSATLFTSSNYTLPIGLVSFQGNHTTDWGPLMAGYTLASLPLVLLFALTTRTFIEGLTQGGLKL